MERESGSDPSYGCLYVVATPIGNLEDLSERARRVLGEVGLLACEDTRHTRKLCERFGIGTRRISLHSGNEASRVESCLAHLRSGRDLALVSDAGTPLVSDPGERLVRAALEAGVRVCPVPGASAVLAALVASGLAGGGFTFHGFLARKGSARQAGLRALARAPGALVLFESPARVGQTLLDLHEVLGSRRVVIGRELTKRFESFVRGRLGDLEPGELRGELTLVIEGAAEPPLVPDEAELDELVRELRARGDSTRDIARALAELSGLPRDRIYRRILDLDP